MPQSLTWVRVPAVALVGQDSSRLRLRHNQRGLELQEPKTHSKGRTAEPAGRRESACAMGRWCPVPWSISRITGQRTVAALGEERVIGHGEPWGPALGDTQCLCGVRIPIVKTSVTFWPGIPGAPGGPIWPGRPGGP